MTHNLPNMENIAGLLNTKTGGDLNKAEEQTSFTEKQIAEVDLYKIDYDWVDQQSSKRELRLAHAALKKDGYFVDLWKHIEKRLKVVDSSYRTDEEKSYVDPLVQKAADAEVLNFFSDMSKQDNKLRGKSAAGEKVTTKIFDGDESKETSNVESEALAEKL